MAEDTTTETEQTPKGPQMVPIHRLQTKNAELRDTKAQLATALAERDALKAAGEQSASIIAERDGLASKVQTLEEDLGLARLGLTDPEAVTVGRALYQQLPAETRPASFLEAAKGWTAEPAKAPRALAAYLAPTQTTTTTTRVPAPPPTAGGNGQAPGAGGAPNVGTLAQLNDAGRRGALDTVAIRAALSAAGFKPPA